ncbi:ribosome biogenesis GTPase YlqF [Mycoplasmopsis iners]|uniref:ribosome biogenesis GTPase YlqF n=1 Tax=Mycoplasmopsis iners TaxID=76630 RepID=UPI0004985E3D|nr:ribosome biogenesis GTPase YlqF [Mycoplasmopsis iners]
MAEEQTLINWYPGHMAKATREIKENVSIADLFIIVLDARCPISSYNEDFDSIAPQKPRLFVITKVDLMDKSKKELIQKRFAGSKVLWLDLKQHKARLQIIKAVKDLMKNKIAREREKGFLLTKIRVFVMGVPNAGKSTLINLVSQKKSLKVANQPGVTRVKKWVAVDDIYFMDTPGILLPKLTDQEAAVKLAMIGSIETSIFPLRFLADNYLKIICQYYLDKLNSHFNVAVTDREIDEAKAYNIFAEIAIKKGYRINNKPDFTRIYKEFITWVRDLKGVTYD